MAYIYLEELEKILPDILDQWIDKDDESWEWIFQEIEQKCHVGAKRKNKKWKKHIEDDVSALKEYVDIHKEDICDLNDWYKKLNERVDTLSNKLSNFSVRINNMDHDIAATKSMAETAKQRTEVDYSKYSGKSDGKISYSNPEAKKLNEELNSMTSDDIAQWCKEQDSKNLQSCTTCKHYCGDGVIKEPCIGCEDYQYWEAKDE